MLTFILVLLAILINPNDLILLLAPVITWLAAMAANWIKAKLGVQGFGGTVMISMVVPIAGFLASLVTDALSGTTVSFIIIFALSFAGVFINRFIVEWTQTLRGEQTAVLPTLTTLPPLPLKKNLT